jgi:sarcosine oxidase
VQHYDVIVAGLGAMGSAALDHLSGRGAQVLGIEPYGIPHGHGSSGGDTRLIRKAYFEHPDYVPLLERAYANWRALEDDTGEALLHVTGALYLGVPEGELIAGSRRSATEYGLDLQAVDRVLLRREFPEFRAPPGYVALFEPEAGFLLCERAVRAQAERALRRGADVAAGERLIDWRADGSAVRVTTDRASYAAGGLVITVGSWSSRLLAELGLPLQVTRQPLFWLQPARSPSFTLGRFPCWAVQRADASGLLYGFPALPGSMASQLGVKLARHLPGEEADPDMPRRPATHDELDDLLAAVTPFLPGLGGSLTGSRVCLYTGSADGHFIVDVHPSHDNVVFACGFSGHGFKFASVMGEVLADLILEGSSLLPVGFLALR